MVSVVIAAHNEAATIQRCITSILSSDASADITVVPNGCHDSTAELARLAGARVVESSVAGKARALNLGDTVATGYPRAYIDADIILPPLGLSMLAAALESSPEVVVVAPARHIDLAGRPVAVRAYFAINEKLPVFRNGLFGRGVVVLSEAGRHRFGQFPDVLADDLFIDSVFSDRERAIIPDVLVEVAAPKRTRDLIRRLARVRRGNRELRQVSAGAMMQTRPSDRSAWFREVVLRDLTLAPAAVVYVLITVTAELLARRETGWGQDVSTREDA